MEDKSVTSESCAKKGFRGWLGTKILSGHNQGSAAFRVQVRNVLEQQYILEPKK